MLIEYNALRIIKENNADEDHFGWKIAQQTEDSTFNIKLFKCPSDECEKYFHSNDEASRHSLSHSHISQGNYNQTQAEWLQVNSHERKKHICPYPNCGRRFTASYNLKIHSRRHSGETPYRCQLCSKAFTDRANYKYHLKIAHTTVNLKDILCTHVKCLHLFKTKKQRLMHHNKICSDCTSEKSNLILLAMAFKQAITNLSRVNKRNDTQISSLTHSVNFHMKNVAHTAIDAELYSSLMRDNEEVFSKEKDGKQ